ncbi:MAG: RluA family pseudouridine synthase [Bacteroidia bacterium]|nr:RluA family pseudouridine synthase [Bacteroidia bacterium]
MDNQKFTYPFCYIPSEEVRAAAESLVERLGGSVFSEGKMMGVLITDKGPLYGFSGLAGGAAVVPGFVPPIFDLTAPDGYFKLREAEISAMPGGPEKAAASKELQDWIFTQYRVHNALGQELSIKEIFALRGLVPPGGTGECAAPKLLEYAYRNGLKPIAMGEFWYGASPASEVREQGRFYPSCTGKCGPLLTWMMQGLDVEPNPLDKEFTALEEPEVLYSDDTIIIVNKPAGMLSVPGRTKAVSLLEWLQSRFGEVHSCHRLDMDTSGVMVFARSLEAKICLELQFAGHEVKKTYRARLCAPSGAVGSRDLRPGTHGTIALPLSLDYYDRPRQMVDYEHGKQAITEYEVLEALPDGELEVRFTPLTGRTHQLRVHAAHKAGIGRPIKGDRLYGAPGAGRLFLIADSILFSHPATKKKMSWCLTTTTHTNHIINNTKTNNQ